MLRRLGFTACAILAFLLVTFLITLWQSPYSTKTLIASAYEQGLGVPRNPAKAAEWYLAAAQAGDPVAQFKRGHMQYYGRGLPVDQQAGRQWLKTAADNGNASGQYLTGLLIEVADAGRDPEQLRIASDWYAKAASQGVAEAQRMLASAYWSGRGVQQNDAQAFHWASKAAAQGDAASQTLLAKLYWFGKGTPPAAERTLELLHQAASQDSEAEEMLGTMALNGNGMPKDIPGALAHYTRAAQQGRSNAQFVLGYLYSGGVGVPENLALANYWFLRAAQQANPMAMISLAVHLDRGQGIKPSKLKACAVLRVALKKPLKGDVREALQTQLDAEEKTLSPAQLTAVAQLETSYSTAAGLAVLFDDLPAQTQGSALTQGIRRGAP
ncbi:hypothetical protein GV819_28970 [Pseudomonas sp. Fl5BN2]|uniref:tetratricopeptide repeat protein n=1 Tax=Pseudomonas sp. Fl5BN2 TaxID=2697652 RepID=UPI001378A59D|nr:SEL1-like repeat protein [Pseudomonas sp. Fl5BN2]NBF06320.1 hypothetical protein [Pseudomonas sp. Fl5BN2]